MTSFSFLGQIKETGFKGNNFVTSFSFLGQVKETGLKGNNFVTSFFFCIPSPFLEEVFSKRLEFAPKE